MHEPPGCELCLRWFCKEFVRCFNFEIYGFPIYIYIYIYIGSLGVAFGIGDGTVWGGAGVVLGWCWGGFWLVLRRFWVGVGMVLRWFCNDVLQVV